MTASITPIVHPEVLAGAAAGDELAFARIVDAHHDDMVRVAFVVCGDAEIANEAAAERRGITPTTVRHQIEQGRIAARKVGRDWWVTPREVERYRTEQLGRPGRKAG